MAHSDSFETCPTDIVHASPERVWELLTNPIRYHDRLGVRVADAPKRHLAVGDRLVFGPAPGLRLSWDVLSIEPLRNVSFLPGWKGRLIRRFVRRELVNDPAKALARLKKAAESRD